MRRLTLLIIGFITPKINRGCRKMEGLNTLVVGLEMLNRPTKRLHREQVSNAGAKTLRVD